MQGLPREAQQAIGARVAALSAEAAARRNQVKRLEAQLAALQVAYGHTTEWAGLPDFS